MFNGKSLIIKKFKYKFIFTVIGEWKEDKANGYGVYIHVNGARYEGNWKDDL